MEGLPSLAVDGPVATLRLNRPDKRNALNRAVWTAIPALLAEAEARPDVRVVALRGASGNFAAGADIGEFDQVFADRPSALAYAAEMNVAMAAIERSPLPVVAVVEGLCIGAGVALALACDLRMAAADARFAITPAKLGLIYSLADTQRIIRATGAAAARDLLLTGRMIDANAALAMGLIGEAVEPGLFETKVAERLGQLAANAPGSLARTKVVIDRIVGGQVAETAETQGWFADAIEGPDYPEGVSAFHARRPPRFPDRQT